MERRIEYSSLYSPFFLISDFYAGDERKEMESLRDGLYCSDVWRF